MIEWFAIQIKGGLSYPDTLNSSLISHWCPVFPLLHQLVRCASGTCLLFAGCDPLWGVCHLPWANSSHLPLSLGQEQSARLLKSCLSPDRSSCSVLGLLWKKIPSWLVDARRVKGGAMEHSNHSSQWQELPGDYLEEVLRITLLVLTSQS